MWKFGIYFLINKNTYLEKKFSVEIQFSKWRLENKISMFVFTSWYVRYTMRYSDGWIGHSIPVRQLIHALDLH